MNSLGGKRLVRGVLVKLASTLIAALLFAASFPNLVFQNGVPYLAWVAFIPVFWMIRRMSLRTSFLWGALYGYAAYGLFNYWLSVFHPLAGLIVGTIYLVYFAVFFPLLKIADILFPRRGYLLQWALWMAYEYLRTQGFLGYAYGIVGYSQWDVLPLIQIASIFGVWGVSALVVFPSAYLAPALEQGFRSLKSFLKREWVFGVLWIIALAATVVYGFASPLDYSKAPSKKIALIQHNTDPWRGGIQAYRENFNTLKRLSLEALAQNPKPDMVVWSETAFVPRIYWHVNYRDDEESYALVKDLLDFLATQDVPFVIGNDDGRLEVAPDGTYKRVDYNAVILFEKGKEKKVYRKLHLVPFTENFPYEKQLPAIYNALVAADTHFWKKGTDATVFQTGDFTFSTPICFEDTFGDISRAFTLGGADLIVNLTNDAWAGSLPCQMQHATMAVFRAVENRRSVVRSTASGQTCAIDPNGKVIAMAPPFVETQLTVNVPIMKQKTFYTKHGDFLAYIFILFSLGALILGGILWIFKRKKLLLRLSRN